MAKNASTDKSADKAEVNDEKVAGKDASKTTQTSTKERESEVSTKVEPAGETDVQGAADGTVAGGVPYGETGLDDLGDDFDGDADAYDGVLGTVQETDAKGDAYDLPWAYLAAEDVQEEKVRTADADDADVRNWNAQTTEDDDETPVALVPVESVPGQTFRVSELPNVEVMQKAGIDVGQFLAGLPVRADLGEDERPRKGIPA